MVDLDTCRKLRRNFETSSWALWSDRFPRRGCVEADPDELVEFIENNVDKLQPEVVFLGLNPSTKEQEQHDGRYTNFHSPKLQHRDVDLRISVEENGFVGAYMTDLTTKPTPNSDEIDKDDVEVQSLIRQFEILGRDDYHVICFGRRVSNLLKDLWGVSHKELDHDVWSFSSPIDQINAQFYSVYHYSQPDGTYTDKLRNQLRHLQNCDLL